MNSKQILILILSILLFNSLFINTGRSHISILRQNNNIMQASQQEFPDKVYTFQSPSDYIEFNPLYLKKGFVYYIYIELVTPGNVTNMKVRVWDPNGNLYEIFDSEMFFEPEYGRWFDIPFGTVLEGNYIIRFDSNSSINFNMLISISEGHKALYDKMDQNDINNIIFSQVTKFHDCMLISHNIEMKTDTSYVLYIGRISSISENIGNEHNLSYTIEDPDNLDFIIYDNIQMKSIDDIHKFNFGTAQAGVYKIKIYIECEVTWSNIAYTVSEGPKISDIIPGNESLPIDDSNDPTNSTELVAIWTFATLGIVIGSVGIAALIVITQKRKSTANLKNLE